jgi:signal transduction histidine kinase
VYAAGLLLRDVERRVTDLPTPEVIEGVRQSIGLLDQAVSDLRGTLGSLQPQATAPSLAEALGRLCNEPYLRALMDVELTLELQEDCLITAARVEHVVAIAREAISNAVRHSAAQRVLVRATSDGRHIRMSIEDDGRGIEPSATAGSGLRNMHDRARLLGGTLDIGRSQHGGTLVALEAPCAEAVGSVRG